MKEFCKLWSMIKSEFSNKEILDGFFGALAYTTLIAIPSLLVMAQIISVFMYRLTFWVVLIIILVALLNNLLHYWWMLALKLKKPDSTINFKRLMFFNAQLVNVFVVLIGLLFIFIFIPMMMV